MLKRKSKRGFAYYVCEKGAECGFMTWDVPTAEECPECGGPLYKKSGKGRNKPFCVNEKCAKFLPEDQRGYYKKKTAAEGTEGEPAGEPGDSKKTAKKPAARKSSAKSKPAKKAAPKKTTKKTGEAT